MGDETIAKIDRAFDLVDAVIDEGGQFLHRVARSGDKATSASRGKVIDVEPTAPTPNPNPKTASPGPIAKPRRFRIIESIDAQTGITTFVVSDDVIRTECPTAESAERVRRALENA